MWRASVLLIAFLSLPLFVLLSDVPAVDPATAYEHAQQSFLHGYLGASQRESALGYTRFLDAAPRWARKFQLLQATVLVWQGLSEEALAALSDSRIVWQDPDSRIEKLAIEATALTHLHRLDEANVALDQAHVACAGANSVHCGSVLRADGLLAMERGQREKGSASALRALEFARTHHDGLLETTALLDLGLAAGQWERHNDAIEYIHQAERKATQMGANNLIAFALGNEGWEEFTVGNPEKALTLFKEAGKRSSSVADSGGEVQWLVASGLAYAAIGEDVLAEKADLRAIVLAHRIGDEQAIINASEDLARIYIQQERPDEADRYAAAALALSQQTGNRFDFIECNLLQGQAAALRHDWQRSGELLQGVIGSPESPTSRRWQAQHAIGRMYESKGDPASAQKSYEAALTLIESARADLKREVSRLTFLENASSIYDDYIHLLVSEGKTQEALEAADWSRARTLQQGLGSIVKSGSNAKLRTVSAELAGAPRLKAVDIARGTNSSLLFYWFGKKQSYLWAISAEETRFVTLPPRAEILPAMERYRHAILGLKDPLRAGAGEVAGDGSSLYQTLIAPIAKQLRPGRPVVLFVDGEMGQLNFETLLVPSPTPHFWIEDATVLQAPSIRMFAETEHDTRRAREKSGTMLLLGDTVPAGAEFRPLPMAAQEMETVKGYFAGAATVLQGAKATPVAYLASDPGRFDYIHFVTHGTASRTDPLESAVILSQGGAAEDSYKLYAREIVRHPISARLVTISACNSSGSKSFAGEGLVGLSWAFLRAGAHNAIGSLWEVSDASTPALMDSLYAGIQRGEPPASALRAAKLSLIHANGRFSRPFYWAPFQLYSGR